MGWDGLVRPRLRNGFKYIGPCGFGDGPLRRRKIHDGRRRIRESSREMGRRGLVRPRHRDGFKDIGPCGFGDVLLRRGRVHDGRRSPRKFHRELEERRMVGPGRDKWLGNEPSEINLAVSGSNLWAGGYFSTAGGVSANNIAKWDGTAWSALGTGMNASLLRSRSWAELLREWDFHGGRAESARTGSRNGTVPRGARSARRISAVRRAGGLGHRPLRGGPIQDGRAGSPRSRVAKWDGTAWSALGIGIE